MSRLITYLMEGDEADRKSISMVFGEVSGGIRALDEMAESYGVHFSESVIDQLYKELDAHIEKMVMMILAIIINDVDLGCDRFGAAKQSNNAFSVWAKGDGNVYAKTEFCYFLIGSNN